ncbi:hypothetical protein [Natrinema thermotolerans]
MSHDNLLPDPEELYDHLVSEFSYFRSLESGEFSRNLDHVKMVHERLKKSDPENWTLNLSPNWVLDIGGKHADTVQSRDFGENKGKAVIGGIIKVSDGSFEEYSLSLSFLAQKNTEARGREENEHIGAPCCWSRDDIEEDWRIARRYHFDIDMGDNDDESKPVSHLQSGGKFQKEHLQWPDPHYCQSPLDKPRLPHPPMDPILILHMLATQYESLRGIIQHQWENHVRAAEDKLWEPYHSTISDWYSIRDQGETFASYIEN